MEKRKKLYCHHDYVRFVTEEKLIESVGENGVLSVSEGKKFELMIFLGKEENSDQYEVRVYKSRPKNKYIPHPEDKQISYIENDKYASFFFNNFGEGINFITMIPYIHKEYRIRVVRRIVI